MNKIEELEERVENLENFIENKIDEKIEEVRRPSTIQRYAKQYAEAKLTDLKKEIGDSR